MNRSPMDTCNGSLYHSRYHEVNGDIYSAGFIFLPAGLKFPTVVIPFLDWLKTQSEDYMIDDSWL